MIATNFRRYAEALARQLPLPFGTVLRWATARPGSRVLRRIRAERGHVFAAVGRIKRPEPRTVPQWVKDKTRAARDLARQQLGQQFEWFAVALHAKARGRLSLQSRMHYVYPFANLGAI